MNIEIGTKLKSKKVKDEEKEFGEIVLISNSNAGQDDLVFVVIAHALHPKPSLMSLKSLKAKYVVVSDEDYLDDDARIAITV